MRLPLFTMAKLSAPPIQIKAKPRLISKAFNKTLAMSTSTAKGKTPEEEN
jgi:hypothetical protein